MKFLIEPCLSTGYADRATAAATRTTEAAVCQFQKGQQQKQQYAQVKKGQQQQQQQQYYTGGNMQWWG